MTLKDEYRQVFDQQRRTLDERVERWSHALSDQRDDGDDAGEGDPSGDREPRTPRSPAPLNDAIAIEHVS